jgi:hypothetical protein
MEIHEYDNQTFFFLSADDSPSGLAPFKDNDKILKIKLQE